MKIPTTCYLFMVYNNGHPYLTLMDNPGMDGLHGYKLLGSCPVDFQGVVLDETQAKIEALTVEMGKAQKTIDTCKEEISKLLAIGHDGGREKDVPDKDIPF